MRHYAFLWWLYATTANTGARVGRYYYFASRHERDAWVAEGNPYRDSGYREAIPARDSELRMLQRLEKSLGECGLHIENWEEAN